MIDLQRIRESLRQFDPVKLPAAPMPEGRAAVALIFAGAGDGLSLCFIRRATRENDHWSGQMAFPGGRAEEQDATTRAVAERETVEEVGLQLDEAEFLGPLSELWIRHGGKVTRDVLSPFAYYIPGECPPSLGISDEVAESYWVPLRGLWDQDNATAFSFSRKGKVRELPGIRHDGQIIWGLTHMMLTSLAEVIGVPLPRIVTEPAQ